MEVTPVALEKDEAPILVITLDGSNIIVLKFVVVEKALVPIEVTALGIIKEVKLVQL
jgi:hypothetical protein